MAREQKIPVKIVPHPTVRTKEGLALSSRNERLSTHGKRHALAIPRALEACREAFLGGEREARTLENILQKKLGTNPGVKIDYATIVDGETLLEVRTIVRPAVVAVAALVEGVRLIDNCLFEPGRAKKKVP
jgi:pantoate--beta-alanine ligase